ncbi:MAG: hypothetical protein M1826_002994 [Phylliscum demangeonii]|nr:MAG: hypothetical protein M1826_002994 [Phylliscum demangeonii]
MESTDSDDPWDWGVDRVVVALCGQDPLWSQLNARPARPDPIALERVLRENAIDGMVLLTSIDDTTAAQNLGLTVFGQRRTILVAIQILQLHSEKFRAHTLARFNTPSIGPLPYLQFLPRGSTAAQDTDAAVKPGSMDGDQDLRIRDSASFFRLFSAAPTQGALAPTPGGDEHNLVPALDENTPQNSNGDPSALTLQAFAGEAPPTPRITPWKQAAQDSAYASLSN